MDGHAGTEYPSGRVLHLTTRFPIMAQQHKIKALQPLHLAAKKLLDDEWRKVMAIPNVEAVRDPNWGVIFEKIISHGGNTYPYVLLGQVLVKASDGSVNALCLQDSSPLPGARDVRMLVKNVVVPWNRTVGKPFPGTNIDPYVNNPARYKNFGDEMRGKAGNLEFYDLLFKVVDYIQIQGQAKAKRFLHLLLIETRHSLEANKRDYVGPARASLEDVIKVLSAFLLERSNGVRLQIVCYAIFKSFAEAFPNFGTVRSYPTNASDASNDRAGDVERLNGDKVDYAIEVKDRTLTLSDVEDSILKARVADVENLLFLVQASPLMEAPDDILKRAAHEFARGIDVNFAEAMPFFKSVLMLLSPEQRAALLKTIHDALHELGAHYNHVQQWINLMKKI